MNYDRRQFFSLLLMLFGYFPLFLRRRFGPVKFIGKSQVLEDATLYQRVRSRSVELDSVNAWTRAKIREDGYRRFLVWNEPMLGLCTGITPPEPLSDDVLNRALEI